MNAQTQPKKYGILKEIVGQIFLLLYTVRGTARGGREKMKGPNETDYVAFHGNVYLKGCIDSHKTGTRVQLTLEVEEDYKDFKSFNKLRKGKAGTGLYRALSKKKGFDEWYGPVDLRFVRWNLSSANGAVVTFEIEDKAEWDKMRESDALDSGYRIEELEPIEFMLIELDGEGKPVNVEQRARLEKYAAKKKWPKGGAQSKRAGRLCADADFMDWVTSLSVISETNPATVAAWVREEANLDTRAQLDHDPQALNRFELRIMKPFLRSQM